MRRATSARTPLPEFITRTAAAKFLGIGTTFLDSLIRTGQLPACKVGRRAVLVKIEDLRRLATYAPLPVRRRERVR